MTSQIIHALIPAAGLSVRFGGTTLKQYAHLLGKPVIAHSIETVAQHPAVASVTVALAEDDGIFKDLVRPAFPDVGTTVGGPSRAQTVMNGIRHILEVHPSAEWVLVHDAARPCLQRSCLDQLVAAGLASSDGAILAVPVSDTVKRGGDDRLIEHTVDRSGLWRAQTPQLFPIRRLAESLAEALADGDSPTDESQAMERAGARPRLVRGSQINIKITGPRDLALAEVLLRHRAQINRDYDSEHAHPDRAGV